MYCVLAAPSPLPTVGREVTLGRAGIAVPFGSGLAPLAIGPTAAMVTLVEVFGVR